MDLRIKKMKAALFQALSYRCLRQAHQLYGLFSLDSSYIATLNI